MDHLRQCLLLLPGYELDEYPRHLPAEEAEPLLAGWSALWHPLILAKTPLLPAWQSASSIPAELGKSLILVPEIAKPELATDWENAEEAHLLEPKSNWREFQVELVQLLQEKGWLETNENSEPVEQLRPDFAALAYAYLQIQLMTRQLRYTSNLDQILFAEQVQSAAEFAVQGNGDEAEQQLQACFDTLGQERDHYYSLDVQLLDVTLLADSTLGKSLAKQLEPDSNQPATTYLAPASLLRALKVKSPASFDHLRARIVSGADSIAGGLDLENPHPLLDRESLIQDLRAGREAYQELDLEPPNVFARYSFGQLTDHPTELRRNGFDGVLLISWADGHYPTGTQPKISWESGDGTFIPALAMESLDANDPASFLSLGWSIGEALDHQHVPTIMFAHWPDRRHEFFDFLVTISSRTPALGRFVHCQNYFSETDEPYHQEKLVASAFKYNWLAKSVSPQRTILATRRFHEIAVRLRSLQNLANIAWQLETPPPKNASHSPQAEQSDSSPTDGKSEFEPGSPSHPTDSPRGIADYSVAFPDLHAIRQQSYSLLDADADLDALSKEIETKLQSQTDSICNRLASLLSPTAATRTSKTSELPKAKLVLNPRSFPQRFRTQSASERSFVESDWNYATGLVGSHRYTGIDVSGLGFLAAPFAKEVSHKTRQHHLAEVGGVVHNEFLEAQIDNTRGHLRSLHVPGRRGNRLSVMLARRDRDDKGEFTYSEMKASKVQMLTSSNMCGLVRATGKLESNGKTIADFEIDYEIWRGSRVMEIAVRLDNLTALENTNAWKSAYVLRVAWPTEAAILYTHFAGRRAPWSGNQIVSPHLIEIDETDYRTQFLTGGLCFHRRTEERFLETILVGGKDCPTSFEHRFGVGVDLPYAMLAAEDFLDQRYAVSLYGEQVASESQGWFFSADKRNVRLELEAPLIDDEGRNVGLRLFASECAGKSTSTNLSLMRRIQSASRVDYQGEVLNKLSINGDNATIVLRANEQCNVDVYWA
ncbi:MAG: hypothetical protein ACE361_11405 [Aureliella sp.]